MTDSMQGPTTAVLLFIVLMTAIAAVAANLGVFGLDPESRFAQVTLSAVLVEVAAAVIFIWKARALEPSTVIARIRFPDGAHAEDISLDLDSCSYEIRGSASKVRSGRPSLTYGNAGWECRIPSPTGMEQAVRLTLVDRSNRRWEVRPFYPLARDVDARPVDQEVK